MGTAVLSLCHTKAVVASISSHQFMTSGALPSTSLLQCHRHSCSSTAVATLLTGLSPPRCRSSVPKPLTLRLWPEVVLLGVLKPIFVDFSSQFSPFPLPHISVFSGDRILPCLLRTKVSFLVGVFLVVVGALRFKSF